MVAGSLLMIAGAVAISYAEPAEAERASWQTAIERECDRYGLDPARVAAQVGGEDPIRQERPRRQWWEPVVVAAAIGIFVWLGIGTEGPPLAVDVPWVIVLAALSLVVLILCTRLLWKWTRFS